MFPNLNLAMRGYSNLFATCSQIFLGFDLMPKVNGKNAETETESSPCDAHQDEDEVLIQRPHRIHRGLEKVLLFQSDSHVHEVRHYILPLQNRK